MPRFHPRRISNKIKTTENETNTICHNGEAAAAEVISDPGGWTTEKKEECISAIRKSKFPISDLTRAFPLGRSDGPPVHDIRVPSAPFQDPKSGSPSDAKRDRRARARPSLPPLERRGEERRDHDGREI